MSGSEVGGRGLASPSSSSTTLSSASSKETEHEAASGWDSGLGASQGPTRAARILLRNRLRVSLPPGPSPSSTNPSSSSSPPHTHALNELLLHRGSSPHLTHLTILLNNRPLTTAIADGLLISTPTGSTAYSLSSGGSIVHPLVKGIIVTPICARSLSFRPLVLPAGAKVGVRVEEGTRGVGGDGGVDVSVDGEKVGRVGRGEVVNVKGEEINMKGTGSEGKEWVGGVPCIIRGGEHGGDEGWVGGLNGLLKFNYPFGDEG